MRDWTVGHARAGCYFQAAMSSNESKTLYICRLLIFRDFRPPASPLAQTSYVHRPSYCKYIMLLLNIAIKTVQSSTRSLLRITNAVDFLGFYLFIVRKFVLPSWQGTLIKAS